MSAYRILIIFLKGYNHEPLSEFLVVEIIRGRTKVTTYAHSDSLCIIWKLASPNRVRQPRRNGELRHAVFLALTVKILCRLKVREWLAP